MKKILLILIIFSINTFAQDKVADHLVLDTSGGPIIIELDNIYAPNHFAQIEKMVDMGIYNGLDFTFTEKDYFVKLGDETNREFGLYEEQKSLLKNIAPEISHYKHTRNAVTMPLPNDAQLPSSPFSFSILLDKEEDFDGNQTIIGFVKHGIDILDDLSKSEVQDNKLVTPLKIRTAGIHTKEEANAIYLEHKRNSFKGEMFDFSAFSFLAIILIQLILFYAKNKIDAQLASSFQLVIMLIAVFTLMAQIYPMAHESSLFSALMVFGLLICFKTLSSLETSRGIKKELS